MDLKTRLEIAGTGLLAMLDAVLSVDAVKKNVCAQRRQSPQKQGGCR